jgi:hypothetical protein
VKHLVKVVDKIINIFIIIAVGIYLCILCMDSSSHMANLRELQDYSERGRERERERESVCVCVWGCGCVCVRVRVCVYLFVL